MYRSCLLTYYLVQICHTIRCRCPVFQSNVSAVTDSDVGDQYMLITFLTDFQYVVDLPFVPHKGMTASP